MNDYIPTSKASEITLYSPRQIRKLCETGRNRQKIYKIPHLDYPYGEHINFYMYLTADGYKLYKSGEYIPSEYIIREAYELK